MSIKQLVELVAIADLENAGDDSLVVDAEDDVDVLHRLRLDVGELLDLVGRVLDLLVGHLELELLNTRLDGVPARQTVADRDVTRHAKVLRVQDLVRRGVVEDRLGVDTRLVGEGAPAGDVVVERDLDLDRLGDEVLNLAEHRQVVLSLDSLGVSRVHAGDETTERGDTVALADAKNRRVDVGRARLEGRVGVGDRAAGVVVEVRLDIARDDAAERANKLVNLAGVGAADGVGDTDPVDANLVDGPVEVEEVDEVGPERVLGRETNLDTLRLDVLDDCVVVERKVSGYARLAIEQRCEGRRIVVKSAAGNAPSSAVFSM